MSGLWLFADRLCWSVAKEHASGPIGATEGEYRHAVGDCACPLRDKKKRTCRRLDWRKRRSCCSHQGDPACFAKSDVVNKRAVHQHVSQRTRRGRLRRAQPVPAMAFSCEQVREYIFDVPLGHALVLFQEPMRTSSCHKQMKKCCCDLVSSPTTKF